MPTHPSPAIAATTSGSRLPLVALPQNDLLTVNGDELPPVKDSLGPGVDVKVLRLDLESGTWVLLATVPPGFSFPIHYHTGPAEVLTLRGRWLYREYPNDPQTAGSYLYEPGGSVHTFYTPDDNTEDTVMFIRVAGANVNFTEEGAFHSIVDAVSIQYLVDRSVRDGIRGIRYINGSATVVAGDS
ncbi:2,4'-dihydroxyacetophenone dioxygenase family protein [Streptomyces sp. NPDC048057]|uniref:2,4'-dihydroxyacetophenone dioxygenase family protein n=1 Tax=Streptomyces sp. NPDC048057 TaxID=3155628 RepID=UPI003401B38B